MSYCKILLTCAIAFTWTSLSVVAAQPKPNIVLVMADDLGYAQTGYYKHPLLRTPNLDRLAKAGLRLDRFYAASAVCSPTRASVLTGKHPVRVGVPSHGHAMHRQATTVIQQLQSAGYATGHFGKWHLDGLRGPGVPIFDHDRFHPGRFGFDAWLSVTNFFDRDPLMSRRGKFESFEGDSSEVTVDQALDFMNRTSASGQPFACVIWFGTPHSPFRSTAEDIAVLSDGSAEKEAIIESMDDSSRQHYGELVAMDRSLGTLRRSLDSMKQLDNTLLWFCSDNGGLPKISPSTTAPLRGNKGTLFEGGVRVPCVIHWPDRIAAGRISSFPAVTSDIAPTLMDLLSLPDDSLVQPIDGISLQSLLDATEADEPRTRNSPIGFQYNGEASVVDDRWKLILGKQFDSGEALFDLESDASESTNVIKQHPQIAGRLREWLKEWQASVLASSNGADYPSGQVAADHPQPMHWTEVPEYQAIFETLRVRPEYGDWITKATRSRK